MNSPGSNPGPAGTNHLVDPYAPSPKSRGPPMFRRIVLTLALAGGLLPFGPGLLAADKKDKKADKPTVAVFRLDAAITEEPRGDDSFSLGADRVLSLKDIVEKMDKAAGDANIKAIVLLADGGVMGTAQREELRQAMAKFRAAG